MSVSAEFLHKTFTVAKALLFGKDVGEDRLRKRLKVCSVCDRVKLQGALMRCDICGCQLAESGLVNLARYETTKDYGCKHPNGDQWKKAGI